MSYLKDIIDKYAGEPRVYNRYHGDAPIGSIDIGRSGPWGNPFVIGPDGNRDEVCDKFDAWIERPEQKALREHAKQLLRGRNLVCFCKPKRCHGDTWLRIANA